MHPLSSGQALQAEAGTPGQASSPQLPRPYREASPRALGLLTSPADNLRPQDPLTAGEPLSWLTWPWAVGGGPQQR